MKDWAKACSSIWAEYNVEMTDKLSVTTHYAEAVVFL